MSEFFDGYSGPKLHPHALPVVGDLRDEVIRQCDGELPPSFEQLAHEQAAGALRFCFEAVRGKHELRAGCESFFGRRFLLMIWVIDPCLLNASGQPISLHEFARLLGCTAPNLSPTTAEFSRLLKIQNAFQIHGWNRREVEVESLELVDQEAHGGDDSCL